MKKRKSEIKSAMSDPFDFLSGLRGGTSSTDTFNVDNLGKSAHKLIGSAFEEQELNIAKTIREVVDSKILVPRDMKVDDSGIPVAANIVEWCTKERFSMINGERPYIEQIIWGIIAFNEACPRCSDVEYLYHDHKVNDTYAKLEKKVAMLEHGVCPHCGWGRSKLVAKKRMKFIQELAVSAGQRCVTADTQILTADGLMRIGEYAYNKPKGFSPFKLDVHNGTRLEQTSDFYRSKSETIHRVVLNNGMWLDGTSDHPVKQWDRGFVRLQNTKRGDLIPVYINQQQFGISVLNITDIVRNTKKQFNTRVNTAYNNCKQKYVQVQFTGSGDACEDLYTVLGLWVAEGRGGSISNTDPEVNEFVYRTLLKYIDGEHLRIHSEGVTIRHYAGRLFLANCLGCTEEELRSGSSKKNIPITVRMSKKRFVCAFLKGLFEGDGGVSFSKGPRNNGTARKYGLGYATISKTLATDLSAMLNNMGIAHTIRKRRSWATNGTDKQISKPFWSINIKGFYMERFRDQIGFMSDRKNKLMRRAIKRYKTRTNLVPFKYENLNCVKGAFIRIMMRMKSELSQHGIPYWTRDNPNKYSKNKVKQPMGLGTLYGRNSQKLTFSLRKLLKNADRALTKDKAQQLILLAEPFHCFMSQSLVDALNRFKALTCPDVILTRVRSIGTLRDKKETYDFTLPETHQFITRGIISHNSGKSMSIAGYFAPYLTHRLLKLQNPNAFYGLKTGTMLHCTFVALTYAQAKDTLWQNFYATLTESQWFQEYHSMLAYFGERYGEKLLKFNDTYVAYPSRGLLCYPAGPDKRVLRGRTRYFTSVDEVGWFDSNKDSNKVKDNAHEVVGALDRSLLTVRGAAERLLRAGYDDVYPGYSMNVSSPSHRNDMIMTLVRRSENSDTMYGVIRPTWEVNPTLPRNSSTMIEAFRTDPITAERDYGAMPPLASSPFLQNHTEIADCAKIKRNGITLRRTVIHKKKRGESFTYANVRKLRTGKHPTVMAIDAGLTDNSFSGVVGSVVDGIVKIHVVFDIIPDVGAPLNHTFIFNDVILPIIEKWNVRVLYADRWNSVKLLQDAKDMVPTVEISAQHSLKYKEMFTVKTLIQQGLLYLPKPESESVKDSLDFDAEAYPSCFVDRPMDHLYLQLATVKDTGKMVDKGDGYTDDTFRALALCVWALHEEDVQIALSMADDLPNTNRPTAIAASKLYSGGGGAIGTGSSSGVQLGISSSRR